MKRIVPLSLFLVLLFMGPASPVDRNGNYGLIGEYTCGSWHEASRQRNNLKRAIQAAWLFGYVSGVNYLAPGNDAKVSGDQIMAYVDHYCDQNPFHRLEFAANALIDEAGGPKADHKWKH